MLRLFLLFAFASSVLQFGPVSDVSGQDDGFKPIFDGKSLAGWTGNEKFWRVEDGAIVGESTEDNKVDVNRFLVWDQGEVDDFVLRLKFKVSGTERANSGVQFRSELFNGARCVCNQLRVGSGKCVELRAGGRQGGRGARHR